MHHRTRPLPIRLLRWSSFLSLALLAACSSPRRGGGPEHRLPPQPPLAGETAFFNNTLIASARVSNPQRPRTAGGDQADEGPREGPGGFGGGFSGPGGGEDRPSFARMGDGMGPGGGARVRGGGGMGGGMPRQSLVVTFRNTGGEPVELTVVEVKSLMGNFVPVPEAFSLAAGQTQVLEAMRSSLANLDELAVSVTLRRGDSRETQVITLRPAE